MTPLRAFVFFRNSSGTEVSVHRELESIASVWSSRTSADCSLLIHIGFTRPDVDDCIPVLEKNEGRVLLCGSAKYAFSNNVTSSINPVAAINSMPVYICTSGFGYEITDETIETRAGISSHRIKEEPQTFGRVDRWLQRFFETDECKSELLAAGIDSDDSYQEFEYLLSTSLRIRLAKARFEYTVGDEPSDFNILGNLRYCPPWLLKVRVNSFPLSVRAANVLSAHSIDTFEDLSKYSEDSIRRFTHLGVKTFKEIASFADNLFAGGPEQPNVPVMGIEGENSSNTEISKQIDCAGRDEGKSLATSFVNAWNYAYDTLRDVDKDVVAKRIGIGCPPMTLQGLSNEMGITRERVRQIEARAIDAMKSRIDWESCLGARLSSILNNRQDALHFQGVEVFDPWFLKILSHEPQFEFAIENFLSNKFHLVKVAYQTFLSRVNQRTWDMSLQEARKVLASIVGDRQTIEQVKFLIDSLITGQADELKDEFWSEATKHAHFTKYDGKEYLVGYGHGLEPKVLKILEASSEPIHYSVVHRRLIESGEDYEVARCKSACANIALQFGQGLFGTSRHLHFTDREKNLVVTECLHHIQSEGPERQWHASELVAVILNAHAGFRNKLNQFTLSLLLKESSDFVYLGRLVWALKSSGATGTANRIDRLQATISILKNAGAPLTQNQIRQRISEERGIGQFFQIFSEGPLVKIDSAHWGLIDRDVPLSANQIIQIQNGLESALNTRQKGMHLSEIQGIVSGFMPEAAGIDPNCLFSLANRSDKFSITPYDYLYLTEWGNPKRLGLTEAAYKVLKDAGSKGISKADGVALVTKLVERRLTSLELTNIFYRADGVFDPSTKLWMLDENSES